MSEALKAPGHIHSNQHGASEVVNGTKVVGFW